MGEMPPVGDIPLLTQLWVDVAAVLVGAFLPFFVRGKFDISIWWSALS